MPTPTAETAHLQRGACEVTIHRHGATVISWKQGGEERLFLRYARLQ